MSILCPSHLEIEDYPKSPLRSNCDREIFMRALLNAL